MPYASNDGVSIHYEVDGNGAAVVLCGDIGLGAWQFGWQYGAVAGPYTAVTVEPRGIGDSDAPAGPYAIRDFTTDLDAVLAAEGIRRAHLVGYGFGGMVALAYAMASSRPRSLVVIGTPAAGAAYDPGGVWRDPNAHPPMDAALAGAVSPAFREAHPDALARIVDWRAAEDATRTVYEAHRAAVESFDVSSSLHELTTPTLVLQGAEDEVCSPRHGEALAEGLPRGEYREIGGVGHFAGIEASGVVNDELLGWLAERAEE